MTGEEYRHAVAQHWTSLQMIRDAVEDLFGPIADLPSGEAVACVLHGPEPTSEALAICEALGRVREAMNAANI